MTSSSRLVLASRASRCVSGTRANSCCTAEGTGPSILGATQIAVPDGFELIDTRDYGEAQVLFLRAV